MKTLTALVLFLLPLAAFAAPTKTHDTETAIFGGGCFWGVEHLIQKLPGVVETEVGYSGGDMKYPKYENVHTGATGHAEVVRVTFKPRELSYENLLKYFFRLHDPTTMNRQGNDVGTQYRSVIFYFSEEQRKTAEKVKKIVDQSGKWKSPVLTQITAAKPFYAAESYHQKYLTKHPSGYTCHFVREFEF